MHCFFMWTTKALIGPRGYKTFSCSTQLNMKIFMLINLKLLAMPNSLLLNIAEHENFSANKYENANYSLVFISRENFMLSWVEHENSFITSGPDCIDAQVRLSFMYAHMSESTPSYVSPHWLNSCSSTNLILIFGFRCIWYLCRFFQWLYL